MQASKVEDVVNAAYLAALMDAKGVILSLGAATTDAARVILSIQRLENELPQATANAMILLQRVKFVATRRNDGLEVDSDAMDEIVTQALKLL